MLPVRVEAAFAPAITDHELVENVADPLCAFAFGAASAGTDMDVSEKVMPINKERRALPNNFIRAALLPYTR